MRIYWATLVTVTFQREQYVVIVIIKLPSSSFEA